MNGPTWLGWFTMNIPLPLEEATGLTIQAPGGFKKLYVILGCLQIEEKVEILFRPTKERKRICRISSNLSNGKYE